MIVSGQSSLTRFQKVGPPPGLGPTFESWNSRALRRFERDQHRREADAVGELMPRRGLQLMPRGAMQRTRTYHAVTSSALLLDTLSVAALAAYCIHTRVRAAYVGPLFRVRKTAGGGGESDISDSGSGVIANLAAYCGAGDGYIVTVYDQGGGGYDLTQATQANQPQCYSGGSALTGANGKLRFNVASSDRLARTTTMGLSGNPALTVSYDVDRGTITDNFDWCLGTNANDPLGCGSTTSTGSDFLVSTYSGFQDWADTASARGYYIMTKAASVNPSAYNIYKNGSALTIGSNVIDSPCNINNSGMSWGDHTDTALTGLGDYSMLFFHSSVLGSTDRGLMNTFMAANGV